MVLVIIIIQEHHQMMREIRNVARPEDYDSINSFFFCVKFESSSQRMSLVDDSFQRSCWLYETASLLLLGVYVYVNDMSSALIWHNISRYFIKCLQVWTEWLCLAMFSSHLRTWWHLWATRCLLRNTKVLARAEIQKKLWRRKSNHVVCM